MTKNVLSCEQLFKHYILKDIFLYNLKIYEIRLCVFLTSKKKILDEMNYDEKMWVSGGDPKTYIKLKKAEEHLKELDLIKCNGRGYEIKEKHFIQNNNIDLYSCKTQRELFVKCLKYWVKNATYISIKKEYVHHVFGEEKRIRNQNIKYTLNKLKMEISFLERKNDYLVQFDKISNKDSEKKSEKIIKPKEDKEKVEIGVKESVVSNNVIDDYEYYLYEQREYARQQLDEIEKEECENYFKEMEKRILADSCNKSKEVIVFNGTEFTAEELDEYFS